MLVTDVDRLGTRVGNLDRHFTQASKDIEEIKISADKAGKRAHRLDNFDFEALEDVPSEPPLPIPGGAATRTDAAPLSSESNADLDLSSQVR